MVTSAKDWKKQPRTGNDELTLPSGNTCRAQFLQPEAFLTSGLIPDSLSDIIAKAIRTKKGLPPQFMDDITSDPEKIKDALKMVDRVLCYVVLEPHVEMPSACGVKVQGETCGKYFNETDAHRDSRHPDFHTYLEDAREEDILYADAVDLDDRMFIFQWAVGGTSDAESFREELNANVGGVPTRKDVARPAKRAPRRK